MSWKSESEDRLARAAAQGEVEGMNLDSVRAQAAATLALVEVTERLAVAQETANLLARQEWAVNATDEELNSLSAESLETTYKVADEISRRLNGYLS